MESEILFQLLFSTAVYKSITVRIPKEKYVVWPSKFLMNANKLTFLSQLWIRFFHNFTIEIAVISNSYSTKGANSSFKKLWITKCCYSELHDFGNELLECILSKKIFKENANAHSTFFFSFKIYFLYPWNTLVLVLLFYCLKWKYRHTLNY